MTKNRKKTKQIKKKRIRHHKLLFGNFWQRVADLAYALLAFSLYANLSNMFQRKCLRITLMTSFHTFWKWYRRIIQPCKAVFGAMPISQWLKSIHRFGQRLVWRSNLSQEYCLASRTQDLGLQLSCIKIWSNLFRYFHLSVWLTTQNMKVKAINCHTRTGVISIHSSFNHFTQVVRMMRQLTIIRAWLGHISRLWPSLLKKDFSPLLKARNLTLKTTKWSLHGNK